MLSKNLSREEFKCKCGVCEYDTADSELVKVVQDVRDYFGVALIITSGNRCPEYNKKIGGSKNSQHLFGRATDIVVKGVDAHTVYEYLNFKYPNSLGLGKYNTFTHVDTRNKRARW